MKIQDKILWVKKRLFYLGIISNFDDILDVITVKGIVILDNCIEISTYQIESKNIVKVLTEEQWNEFLKLEKSLNWDAIGLVSLFDIAEKEIEIVGLAMVKKITSTPIPQVWGSSE